MAIILDLFVVLYDIVQVTILLIINPIPWLQDGLMILLINLVISPPLWV
jgi:hypothetical protein